MSHVSPSQQSTWLGCNRKWAYTRIARLPGGPKAEWGRRFHEIMEEYGRHGTVPDMRTAQGRTALTGLHLVPLPGDGLCEHEIREDFGGVPYVMAIDRLYGYTPGASVVVMDYKTTGDFQYQKTPEELRTDPQRIDYAHWAAERCDVPDVTSYWLYFRRAEGSKVPEARPTVCTEDRATISARFWDLHTRVSLPIVQGHELLAQYRLPDGGWHSEVEKALDTFPRNYEHCGAFGGCKYAPHCHRGNPPPL